MCQMKCGIELTNIRIDTLFTRRMFCFGILSHFNCGYKNVIYYVIRPLNTILVLLKIVVALMKVVYLNIVSRRNHAYQMHVYLTLSKLHTTMYCTFILIYFIYIEQHLNSTKIFVIFFC